MYTITACNLIRYERQFCSNEVKEMDKTESDRHRFHVNDGKEFHLNVRHITLYVQILIFITGYVNILPPDKRAATINKLIVVNTHISS